MSAYKVKEVPSDLPKLRKWQIYTGAENICYTYNEKLAREFADKWNKLPKKGKKP